jgi:hypothetical protein
MRYYKLFCRNKAKEFRAREVQMRQQLHEAKAKLHEFRHNPCCQDRHGGLTQQVQVLEEKAVVGKKVCSQIGWMLKGDPVSKEFFQAIQKRPESATIALL